MASFFLYGSGRHFTIPSSARFYSQDKNGHDPGIYRPRLRFGSQVATAWPPENEVSSHPGSIAGFVGSTKITIEVAVTYASLVESAHVADGGTTVCAITARAMLARAWA
ncbi:MAG TPA: hypothetical protein VGX76_14065 [Pirellulales bacterium]|jgi:hypothetical protein|nr:hypothetical protein [Pirellulales bacterium]